MDYILTLIAFIGIAIPGFILAVLIIAISIFYFDSAYFVEQSQLIGLYRCSQGRTWKLPGDVAQTLSPYFFSQMAHQDYEYDVRIGIGVRWQIWLNEDEFRAYRHKLTTRLEYQQPLSGDLYQQTPGVRLSFQINL